MEASEAINDSSKLIAQALEQLRPLGCYAWRDDDTAATEIDPIVELLEKALVVLTNKM